VSEEIRVGPNVVLISGIFCIGIVAGCAILAGYDSGMMAGAIGAIVTICGYLFVRGRQG